MNKVWLREYPQGVPAEIDAGEYPSLKALIEDPFFAWLRPFSGLIVAIDEALAGDEPVSEAAGRAFVEQARELVAVDEGDEPTVNRYDLVCRRDPNVLVLHVELSSRIADALKNQTL
jgi:hypothetical protein